MECYFDNAATTAVFPEVKELMMTLLDVNYGKSIVPAQEGINGERL